MIIMHLPLEFLMAIVFIYLFIVEYLVLYLLIVPYVILHKKELYSFIYTGDKGQIQTSVSQ